MKLSELVEQIQKLKDSEGDLAVLVQAEDGTIHRINYVYVDYDNLAMIKLGTPEQEILK